MKIEIINSNESMIPNLTLFAEEQIRNKEEANMSNETKIRGMGSIPHAQGVAYSVLIFSQ